MRISVSIDEDVDDSVNYKPIEFEKESKGSK